MRAKFSFNYGQTLTAEQADALNAAGIQPLLKLDDETGKVPSFGFYEADLEKVLAVLGYDTPIELRGAGEPRPLLDLADAVRAMQSRLDARGADPTTYVNTKVDVHVPGNALLSVDDVMVEEDLCTDELQRLIGVGWRIVAVCPQPNQRRPDYVLGRRLPIDEVF